MESRGYYDEKRWDELKDLSQSTDKATSLRLILEGLGINISQDQKKQDDKKHEAEEASGQSNLDHEGGNETEDHSEGEETSETPNQGQTEGNESGEEIVNQSPSQEEEEREVQAEEVVPLRRSTRIRKDPSNWVNTRVYFNAQAVEHPSQAVCTFAEFPEEHCTFMVSLDESFVPRTYEEAMKHDLWKESVGDEADAMIRNDTWYESELPKGKKAVSSRWIFTIKYLANGKVDRRKTRLVARGFTQTYGEDYIDTFAPVA